MSEGDSDRAALAATLNQSPGRRYLPGSETSFSPQAAHRWNRETELRFCVICVSFWALRASLTCPCVGSHLPNVWEANNCLCCHPSLDRWLSSAPQQLVSLCSTRKHKRGSTFMLMTEPRSAWLQMSTYSSGYIQTTLGWVKSSYGSMCIYVIKLRLEFAFVLYMNQIWYQSLLNIYHPHPWSTGLSIRKSFNLILCGEASRLSQTLCWVWAGRF